MKSGLFSSIYFFVLIGILSGIFTGIYFPSTAIQLKPLGDIFIQLIKMLTGPIIFLTVVTGIAGMQDLKKVGKIGGKAILYFEIITTMALLIGLVVVNVIEPGKGMNIEVASLDQSELSKLKTGSHSIVESIIPKDLFSPFIDGAILQVLFLAVLGGFSIALLKEKTQRIIPFFEMLSSILFKMLGILMRFSPIAAFGAMAFTIGKYGTDTLLSLAKLMGSVYLTCFLFVVLVLGLIVKLYGFSLIKYLKHIKEEIFLVLGTSSSESALPSMIQKMEEAGCSKSAAGLIIPTGYSFNLDGTAIYLTMAAVFIAQATNTVLSWQDQFVLLGILMLTSKGAAAVTGGGLITLAATLSTMDLIPAGGIALIIGVDRFMSEARAITNLIGNGIATIVVSKWDKEFDEEKGKKVLS